ncbi:MAG: restriction endonuclease subunit S [Paenibacillus sp.]|uniref:restriction endonuclease subunit S n=1 Tax=Paenibacillus sp. TaxID=58172 RepID=UPI002906BE74|nr:restriction endonuclease subunit S [Paenibacillus sp.]MDU4696578.1 restriction endonuclease subunit S [Paenibacillus sp.]
MNENKENVPKLRFPGFTDGWEQRRLGDLLKRVNERNSGEFGREHWISVAKMYFQDPDKVQSNNIDTRTYVMRKGDIAFEGHPNNDYKFGRFVLNDIGDGVVSELFPIYRYIGEYDLDYWRIAIQIERIMAPIFAKAITASGNSSNKLDDCHFLRQKILVPKIEEQEKIGYLFRNLDHLITLHQRKLNNVKNLKAGLLQKMFPKAGEDFPEVRFPGFTDAWEQRRLGEIAERVSVGIATSSSEYFTDRKKGVPFIKNQNIKQNRIDDSNLEFISKDFDQANSTKRVKTGDILTVRTGYPGLSAVVPAHLNGAQTFTTLITRLKEKQTLPEFVSTFINSNAGMRQITGMEAGGAQKNVNAGTLQNLFIPIPSFDEQKMVTEFFKCIDHLITLHQRKLKHLQEQKKALLQQMFV